MSFISLLGLSPFIQECSWISAEAHRWLQAGFFRVQAFLRVEQVLSATPGKINFRFELGFSGEFLPRFLWLYLQQVEREPGMT